jgi:diaminopimelate decarboxylase
MKIYISGLYSGTNPQPGVGIARSLREAYPEATLIGVEYSNRCSGIHWPGFDDIWLQRPWNELDLDLHAAAIGELLDAGGLFISSNDLEVMWLADVFPEGHANLLTPPARGLDRVAKPAVPAHEGLPVGIPTFVTTDLSDWDLHTFCRQHDWKVWLKGPYYEAIRVRSWAELDSMRNLLCSAWSTEKLFLQAHVSGYEESISLAAYKGELLHCVSMRKRDLTEISKTWAGDVSEAPEALKAPLRRIIRDLNWTGGAELEMVRDADGKLWLLEWNPRFPAWIHGATIAGHNMSAILIEGATGIAAQKRSTYSAPEFTRVVLEIPVKPQMPLSPLPEPFAGGIGHSLKHPAGLPGFAEKLHRRANAGLPAEAAWQQLLPDIPDTFRADISALDMEGIRTPQFLFMPRTASALFERAAAAARSAGAADITVSNAYSIKTNPDPRMLGAALQAGFLAEAISPPEVSAALRAGFRPDQIILNGPGKWWRKEELPADPLHAVFCDSTEDLRRVAAAIKNGELQAGTIGVRLRTPGFASRFGIPMHSPEVFEAMIGALQTLPPECEFGIHFHMASSNVGVSQWKHLFESMLRWCSSIEALSGKCITCLDIGGGWAPDDWLRDAGDRFGWAVALVRELLPHVRQIVSEPGKALAQPSMALAMRILEIQEAGHDAEGRREVVVDGSIAELPMYFVHPHRILHRAADSGSWQPIGRGKAHLLGRLCMEHDVVATNVALPESARAGDLLVFCDAGAYDKSMSYVFGHG